MRRSGLRVVSLFSGAGGLDIAFCETGVVADLFSTDSHSVFLETVSTNVPKHFPYITHQHLVADARQLSGRAIQSTTGGSIDIVFGGPPCDDFTSFGLKRGMAGDKGPIVFDFARLVGELVPKAFLFENVPNLQSMCRDGFTDFLSRLRNEGYVVDHTILAACDFGAPTVRQRLFVVGLHESLRSPVFEFPHRTHGDKEDRSLFGKGNALRPFVTVGQALAGLPDVKSLEAQSFLNHTGRSHRPSTIKHIQTVPQGVAVSRSYRYRPALDGLSRSLTAGLDNSTKSYLHPIYHREMSVREYARLHGFPDSWYFCGTHHNGIKQVANAVPVPLGRAIALALTTCLVKTLGDGV